MSALLAPRDRDRLAHVLGLLGSEHVGERAAAALAADRMVRSRGLTWHELLAPHPCRTGEDRPNWRSLVAVAQSRPDLLNPAEADFLANIATLREVSPKQRTWLDRLAMRARA